MRAQDSVGNEIFSAVTSNLWLWGAWRSGLLTEFKEGSAEFSISLSLRSHLFVMSRWLVAQSKEPTSPCPAVQPEPR